MSVAVLLDQRAAWDALVVHAAEPQPFYAARTLAAHRDNGLCNPALAAVVVQGAEGPDALLPFVLRRDVSGFGGRVARPFLSPYITASAPLVADGPDLDARLDALVAGLAQASGGRCWRWPLLPTDSRVGAGLIAAMRRAGWQVATVSTFARPVLDRRASYDALLSNHPHRSRFKDLRRRRRRLAELGSLTVESATEGPALDRAREEFLSLEAVGWKGAAGTALRSHPSTKRFAQALFHPDQGPVSVRADVLRLNGTAIAASLALVAGGTAFLLKTAYDEALRAHAPGLVLEDAIIQACHAEGFADRLDAATLPGSALESLYLERETIAEILAVPPGRLVPLTLRRQLIQLEHRARDRLKHWLRRR